MAGFIVEQPIAAPRERVWAVLADFGAIAKWDPGVRRSYPISSSTGEGAERHCDRQRPSGRPAGFTDERAVDWREGESFRVLVLRSSYPVRDLELDFAVSGDDSACSVRVTCRYEMRLGAAGRSFDRAVFASAYRRALQGMLRGLRDHVESAERAGAGA